MYYGLHSHFLILHFALTIDQKQASTHHRIFVHPQNFFFNSHQNLKSKHFHLHYIPIISLNKLHFKAYIHNLHHIIIKINLICFKL